MTRLSLAQQIAGTLNGKPDDVSAKVWHGKNGAVRIYCRKNTGGKRGWIDAGYVEVCFDGSVQIIKECEFELRYFFRAELEQAKTLRADAEQPTVSAAPAVQAAATDESESQLETSWRAAAAAEEAREQG